MLAAVMPLPREEVTPPVTKTYFAMGRVLRGFFECYRKPAGGATRRADRSPGWAASTAPGAGGAPASSCSGAARGAGRRPARRARRAVGSGKRGRYQEAGKIQEDGPEIDWPIPYWWVDIGATMQNIWLAAVNEGLGCGFVGGDFDALKANLGLPDEFTPIGVM